MSAKDLTTFISRHELRIEDLNRANNVNNNVNTKGYKIKLSIINSDNRLSNFPYEPTIDKISHSPELEEIRSEFIEDVKRFMSDYINYLETKIEKDSKIIEMFSTCIKE